MENRQIVEIESEELKSLQLAILADVHEFCVGKGINYSLAYGTLLGAVRHKGYIPWDDDIDIMMLRKDYDVFVRTYGNEVYQVINSDTSSSCYLPYSKVYDTRTVVRENLEIPMEYGVNIDVFPVDNVPDSDAELQTFLSHKRIWNNIFILKTVKTSKNRSFIKNAILAAAHLLLYPMPIRKVTDKMKAYSTRYSAIDTKRVGIVAPSDNSISDILDKRIFSEYCLVRFESLDVHAVADSHSVLASAYGNYMQLPPEGQRCSHHSFTAGWLMPLPGK